MHALDENRLLGVAVLVTLAALAAAGCVPVWQYKQALAQAEKQAAPTVPAAVNGVQRFRAEIKTTKPLKGEAASLSDAVSDSVPTAIAGAVSIFNSLSPFASVASLAVASGARVGEKAIKKEGVETLLITIDMPVGDRCDRWMTVKDGAVTIVADGDKTLEPAAKPPPDAQPIAPAVLQTLLDERAAPPQPPGIRVQ